MPTYQRNNFYIEDFVYILVICEATSVRSSEGFKISSATNFSDFKHIVGKRYFFWANHCPKIYCLCVRSGAPDLIYPGTSLYEHIL